MKITAKSSLREVAFRVCTALDRAGTTAVLSGGGAATLYAPRAIQSYDLDFILELRAGQGSSARAIEELGFTSRGQHYEHAASRFLLEFPPGPLAIGGDRIERWDTLRKRGMLLHVISPTDSCRDRLASYFHFRDASALEQALSVYAAAKSRIDMDLIRRWSRREGHMEQFQEFRRRVGVR